MTSIGDGVPSPTRTSRPGSSSPRHGSRPRRSCRCIYGATNSTVRSTSPSSARRGRQPTLTNITASVEAHPSRGRRAGHLDAVEPRHRPPCESLRSSAVRAGRQSVDRLQRRHRRRPRTHSGSGRRRYCSHCRAPSTCTRAKSWAWRRSRTCPTTSCRTPSGSAPGSTERGRDGCRVPIPWTPEGPSLGFGPTAPWLPQPAAWTAPGRLGAGARRHVDAVAVSPGLATRREQLTGREAPLRWLDLGPDVVAFARGDALVCVVNLGGGGMPTARRHRPGRRADRSTALRCPSTPAVWLVPA